MPWPSWSSVASSYTPPILLLRGRYYSKKLWKIKILARMLTRATGTAKRSESAPGGAQACTTTLALSRAMVPQRGQWPVEPCCQDDGWPDGMVLCASGPRALCDSGRASARAQTPVGGHQRQACTIEFIPLSFWYDAPLRSRDSDRRHDPWLVYGSPSYSPAPWSSWTSRA